MCTLFSYSYIPFFAYLDSIDMELKQILLQLLDGRLWNTCESETAVKECKFCEIAKKESKFCEKTCETY